MHKNSFNLTKFTLKVTDILLNLDKIILFINEATTLLSQKSLAKYPQVSVTQQTSWKETKWLSKLLYSKHLDKMGISNRTQNKNVFMVWSNLQYTKQFPVKLKVRVDIVTCCLYTWNTFDPFQTFHSKIKPKARKELHFIFVTKDWLI